jgi:hypothetical protein
MASMLYRETEVDKDRVREEKQVSGFHIALLWKLFVNTASSICRGHLHRPRTLL